jgi:regulator of sigma E protease
MSKPKVVTNKYFRVILVVIVAAAILFFISQNIHTFGNVLLVLLGFGAVVLVHEFGHFIIAKLSGIKVEAFSIFMPPVLLGLQKTENGFRFRILPEIFPKEEDKSGDGSLSFTVGKKGTASETEYRIGLIPFGGFVKMLGQDDVGPVKSCKDPRSYANKPVLTRAAVLAAGVTFNVISAGIIFMIVFLVGINLPPAMVGGVIPNSPAANAGLKAGDEIIEIDGKNYDLDFSNIGIAAALSGKDEKVPLTVRHPDGSIEEVSLVAKELPGEPVRVFGIIPPQTLKIAELSKKDADILYKKTGLRPGDQIKSADGKQIQNYRELDQIVKDTIAPTAAITAERKDSASGNVKLIKTQIPLSLYPTRTQEDSNSTFGDIYSLVPRLRISNVSNENSNPESSLQPGDIVLKIDDVENPTYEQMREVTQKYGNKDLPVEVLRKNDKGIEQTLTITVVPKRQGKEGKFLIGVGFVYGQAFDLEHPVVAATVPYKKDSPALAIPSGASITSVDGTPVSNFYDIIREIRKYPGQRITIDYRLNEQVAGAVSMDVGSGKDLEAVKSGFAEIIPFEDLKRRYKAAGPVDALVMGYRKTIMFIAQTYVTLKRLAGGLVSPKNLMGPVGIITFSYRIVAEQPLVYYIYFLGLINAVIAVFNFLPLPPLDGGLVVLLLIEKIKGSALSERAQGIIAYTGWALILTLLVYVTFNDIVRNFFSPGLGT